MYNMMTIVNTALWYTGKLLKVNPRILITRQIFFFFLSFMKHWMLYEMLNVSWTYCGNHFTIYVHQTSMLYALSLYGDTDQSSSVQSLNSVWLWPDGLQHARPLCPSPTPGVHSNLCPLSQWCYPTISSSVIPLLLLPSVFPSIRVFSNEPVLRMRWPKY